jgi:hypothetical protein
MMTVLFISASGVLAAKTIQPRCVGMMRHTKKAIMLIIKLQPTMLQCH